MKKFYTTILLLLFAVSMMYGQNLVTNPGFENWTGATPDNWTFESGVTFSQENGTVHGGTSSAMVTLTTETQGDTDTQNTAAAVVAGDPFNSSVWVYDNDPAGRVSLVLYWDGASNTYSQIYSEDMDAWQELVFDDFVPEGATGVKVGFRFYDVSDGWDGDAVFYVDDYSFEINTTVYPEPTNYPTDFTALSEGPNINLTWTDAIGDQLPRGYLILGNNDGGGFVAPVDGTPVADDLDWADNNIAVNVMYGTEMLSVGVEPNNDYNFTIYPYSNTAEDIDYKTDGTAPVASASSGSTTVISLETFDTDLGTWNDYNVSGEQAWGWDSFGLPPGCAKMNGFAGAPMTNEDWLISPGLNLSSYETITFSFDHARNWASNDGLFVLVSTDYEGISEDPSINGTWADITSMFTFPEGGGSWDFIPAGSADVSMYDGESTYFAFKYTSTDAAASTWEIDNALISGVAAVGISEMEETNIQVYPNPATDMLNVNCDDGKVKIINLAGQSLMELETRKGVNQLNIQHLNQGMYMIQYTNKAGAVSTQKIMIR